MPTRRGFVAGLMAASLLPRPGWAEAGAPDYLATARMADGSYGLCGLTVSGAEVFRLPLPGRGHAAAAHPDRPEAVAFARRPGTFAVVIDCRTGQVGARLEAGEGRHFYGHGVFSRDGGLLFAAENDFGAGRGVIGVREVARGYAKIGELSSGGVGPHEITRLPGTDVLVVANGGIDTHPDAGRLDLEIPLMRPNLSYVGADGALLDQVELTAELRRNSIRHLSVRADGLVAFAMQWHGDAGEVPALLGLHRMGQSVALLRADDPVQAAMQGYAGSVAFSADGRLVGISSPPGGQVQVFDAETGGYHGRLAAADVCGLGAGPEGFVVTSGTGETIGFDGAQEVWRQAHERNWDNHLVRISAT